MKMNYAEFKKMVNDLRFAGCADMDLFKELLNKTICNENEMKVVYKDQEEMDDKYKYELEEDTLYISKNLNKTDCVIAYISGIAAHTLNKETETDDYELFVLKNLVLINLLISTFKIGKQGDYQKYFRYVTKYRDINFDEVIDDLRKTYKKIIQLCF